MIATLTRIFGIKRLDQVEDAVQDAMARALRFWPYQGLPDNPTAWLIQVVKNRMHMDLLVEDLGREVRRLEMLGASRLGSAARQEFGQTWFVLADPEGNEFCVAQEPE